MQQVDHTLPAQILEGTFGLLKDGRIQVPCVVSIITCDGAVLVIEFDKQVKPRVLCQRVVDPWRFPICVTAFSHEKGKAEAWMLHAVPTPTAPQAEA